MIFQQIDPTQKLYRTIVNTTYLYPPSDVAIALSNTQQPYTFDGTIITCPDIDILETLYYEIWYQTSLTQPVGNLGYTMGVGTVLENLGKTIYFQAPNGNNVITWRLMKQLTNQSNLPVGGNSPEGTVGYTTVYNTQGQGPNLDGPYVVHAS